MDPNKKDCIALLNYAAILASGAYNSPARFSGGSVRRSIVGERSLLEGSIIGTISIIERLDILCNFDVLISSFKMTYLQLLTLWNLLEVTWPDEFKKAGELRLYNSIIELFRVSNQFHKEEATNIIRIFNSTHGRKELFFDRIFSVKKFILQSASIFNIDLQNTNVWQIKRSISFPPEMKQAGISILSYFNHVLSKKYPDIDVGVTIEQSGQKVTLVVETPEGQKERVERELSDYGLVIVGELAPEKFIDDPYEVIMLKQKLELAALEIRQTKELLYSERKQYDSRITNLENESKFLKNILDKNTYTLNQFISVLNNLSDSTSKVAIESVNSIINVLKKGISEEDRDLVINHLMNIHKEDQGLFNKIEELIIKGAIQGTAGNYLYSFLQALSSFM